MAKLKSSAYVLVAACLTSNAWIAVRAADPIPVDLRKAADEYDLAQQKGDRALLERLLADDYLLVNSGGEVENKSQFVAESVSPSFRLNPYKVEDEVIRVSADQAVLGGRTTLSGTSDGKPFTANMRFADIWRKNKGRWQVTYTQVTRIPQK